MPPDVKSKAGHAAKSIKAGDAFFQHYESKLQKAKIMAFIANVMYSLNWFLGFCALTWASAVILGGLLTSLSQHDYYSVVALLLLEAVRLSIITFFAKFVTWKLVRGSADPQRLVYNDARRQRLQGIARILEQAVQLTVIAISVLVPIRRLGDLNSFSAMRIHAILIKDFDGLETSLYIFYVLVLVNGAIAGLAVIFSKNVVPFFVDSFSLRKYYETIVWKGMDEGLLHARDFELLSWTFQMQADEYRRNTRALVVKELYGDMMKFLYYHPRHKGFEAAKVALESEDTFEREAAANIVGLWVLLTAEVEESAAVKKDKKADGKTRASASAMAESKESGDKINASSMSSANPLARLLIQARLLEKLADALDSDESGRAATVSFEKLAETDPEGVLMVRSEEKDEKVADILMDRIHRAVELGKPDNAVIYIKAMIPLIMTINTKLREEEEIRAKQTMMKKKGKQTRIEEEEAAEMEEESEEKIMTAGNGLHEIGDYCTPAKLGRLKKDMWRIVSDTNALKRVQAVAAHVFCCLCKGEAMHEKLWKHLMEEPKGKQHILKEEQQIFLKLPIRFEMTWPWKGELIEVREPVEKSESRLPWLARPITALVATLFTLIILVISSSFIMRYAHF